MKKIDLDTVEGNKKRSVKAFNEFIDLLIEEGYELKSEYVKSDIKVILKPPCGHDEYEVIPKSFKDGGRCPGCSRMKLKEIREKIRLEFVDLLINEKYELKSEYINTKTKVTLKPPCGHGEYKVTPNNFKKGNRCPCCEKNRRQQMVRRSAREMNLKAKEEFMSLVTKEGYELRSEYISSQTKVVLKPSCGHEEYKVIPNNFKKGNRCPECAREKNGKLQKERSNKSKLEFVEMLEKEGYELLGEYKGSDKKVSLKCNKDHIYSVRSTDFKGGVRCPECNTSSHGEELTKKLLKQYNIVFEREKKFNGLTGLGGGNLRFDFYIPEHSVVIEINGEGHYKEYTNKFFNNNIIRHDKIKRDFCKKQGIKLYDIEYLSTVIGKNNALKHVEERVLEIIRGIAA
jgi:hypothetical protein